MAENGGKPELARYAASNQLASIGGMLACSSSWRLSCIALTQLLIIVVCSLSPAVEAAPRCAQGPECESDLPRYPQGIEIIDSADYWREIAQELVPIGGSQIKRATKCQSISGFFRQQSDVGLAKYAGLISDQECFVFTDLGPTFVFASPVEFDRGPLYPRGHDQIFGRYGHAFLRLKIAALIACGIACAGVGVALAFWFDEWLSRWRSWLSLVAGASGGWTFFGWAAFGSPWEFWRLPFAWIRYWLGLS